jgi:hypothetical protein
VEAGVRGDNLEEVVRELFVGRIGPGCIEQGNSDDCVLDANKGK